jgi:hypothetical protein
MSLGGGKRRLGTKTRTCLLYSNRLYWKQGDPKIIICENTAYKCKHLLHLTSWPGENGTIAATLDLYFISNFWAALLFVPDGMWSQQGLSIRKTDRGPPRGLSHFRELYDLSSDILQSAQLSSAQLSFLSLSFSLPAVTFTHYLI